MDFVINTVHPFSFEYLEYRYMHLTTATHDLTDLIHQLNLTLGIVPH